MGGGVSVGNAVEGGKVGNGVKVAKSKLNNAVGVACVPSLGKTMGLGTMSEEPRDGNQLIRMEQRKQNTTSTKQDISILPVWPCWLYLVFRAEMNELPLGAEAWRL